jgi:transposase
MYIARSHMLETLWSSLADCRGCRRGAFFGAILGWVLAGLTILSGDRQQLALAAVLAAMGLTALWGLHRLAVSIKGVPNTRRMESTAQASVESPLSEIVEETAAPLETPDPVVEATRFDVTDLEWSVIEPLLPVNSRGGARADDRRVLNGVLWRLRAGAPWTSIPERYGPHTLCASRFGRWRTSGVWDEILAAVTKVYDGEVQIVDSASAKSGQPGVNRKAGTAIVRVWVARPLA